LRKCGRGLSVDRPYDEDKFVELVMYAAERLRDAPAGGAMKMNKVCWYAEIEYFRIQEKTITGADYQKLEWGPAPRRLLPVRQQLVDSGQAELVESDLGEHLEDRLIPLRPADLAAFTRQEISVIDRVLTRLREMDNEEPAWYLPDMSGAIEPELSYLRRAVVTSEVRERARQIALDRGTTTGLKGEQLRVGKKDRMEREHREVRMHRNFALLAVQNFPPGGWSDSRPTFRMFLDGPLRAFEAAFQYWERNVIPYPGVDSIRFADVANHPDFPLLQAIAVQIGDPDVGAYIELTDLVIHWDFWTPYDDIVNN
jgi:Protein of unknown function (DUF4065)